MSTPSSPLKTAAIEQLSDLFVDWAEAEGILPRITDEQCEDLARAFIAGYLKAVDGCIVASATYEAVRRFRSQLFPSASAETGELGPRSGEM